MKTLPFKVEGQRLKRADASSFTHLVAGSKGYLRASFSFDKDWDGLARVAVFTVGTKSEYFRLKNDICDIPDSVTDSASFYVSVVGVKQGAMITTNKIRIKQEKP